jgi:neutral ceramidase
MRLRAGVGVQEISPRQPMFLVGYPHVPRLSTGIHDPLLASALYLANDQAALLLLSVDVLFITRESARFCREAIARECGLPAAHVLISATHTHSGPVTAPMLAWREDPVVPAPDPEYLEAFHNGIIRAAVEACRAARPAELAVTTTQVSGVGSNRLAPNGPFDAEAGILAVRSEGRLLAVNLIYGMHPTVLHEDSRLVSADFPGYARQALREEFPGLTTIYHTAPAGNLSPRYHVRGQTFAEAERLGRRLGGLVAASLKGLGPEDFRSEVSLAARDGSAELIPNRFATVAEAQLRLDEARQHFERLRCEGAAHGPLRTAECVVFGCEEGLTLAKAQAAGETARLQEHYRQAEVQVFRIGEVLLVGLPGEQFVEYSLQIKREAPARTFVVSLANGELQGYIVTPEAGKGFSYEAAFSLFAAESGRALVDTALKLVRELRP